MTKNAVKRISLSPGKLNHLRYEFDGWKRLVGFMMDENIHQKNKISDILKEGIDNGLLAGIEDYHGRFIKEDELIGLLRNDLAEADRLLVREIFEDGQVLQELNDKLEGLRHNMNIAENQFGKLKREFNGFLSANL